MSNPNKRKICLDNQCELPNKMAKQEKKMFQKDNFDLRKHTIIREAQKQLSFDEYFELMYHKYRPELEKMGIPFEPPSFLNIKNARG